MRVLALSIRNFRGIASADVVFDDHAVFIGPNGVGKSTLVDALSLVFGRSKLVPQLTEHDFRGSAPEPAARIKIVATLGGFTPDDPEEHRGQWFRQGRGIEKYWSAQHNKVIPERTAQGEPLCIQIGLSARFDHMDLTVEQVRYFHDDESVDPFDEGVVPFPNSLLNEIGFYVLPARRSWDLMVSFSSELFRKTVTTSGSLPSNTVIDLRNNVRSPAAPIEQDPAIAPLVAAVNQRLARLIPGAPQLQIRLTATDSEAVLKALVPHYTATDCPSLPAARHGGGLLALQTLLLLLETGRTRLAAGQSFILALEEPELHVPPGLQRQIVSEAKSVAQQTMCTTHSPRVAACYPAERVYVMRRTGGNLSVGKLLLAPDSALPNAARKLLIDERYRLLEAMMYPVIFVPEGRIDLEFLRLLVEVAQGSGAGSSRFETTVGIVPTPDASVIPTTQRLAALRGGVMALVDGDSAGDDYVAGLASLPNPPQAIVQWPVGWMIEDVVAWVAAADTDAVTNVGIRLGGLPITSADHLVARLKSDDRSAGGLKQHYLAYEEIAYVLRDSVLASARAKEMLDALANLALGEAPGPLLVEDTTRGTAASTVFRLVAP